MIELKFKKLHPDAQIPRYTREEDACMDITTIEEGTLPPGECRVFKTGLACAIPKGWEMQIRGRSGLAYRHGISLAQGIGTIDSEYRGELGILLRNSSREDFKVEKGMRIAQICLFPVNKINSMEVTELDETERGTGGFGSSGLK